MNDLFATRGLGWAVILVVAGIVVTTLIALNCSGAPPFGSSESSAYGVMDGDTPRLDAELIDETEGDADLITSLVTDEELTKSGNAWRVV